MKGARVTARRTAEAVAEGRSPKAVGCGAAHKVSVFLKRAGERGSDGASKPERLKDPTRTLRVDPGEGFAPHAGNRTQTRFSPAVPVMNAICTLGDASASVRLEPLTLTAMTITALSARTIV